MKLVNGVERNKFHPDTFEIPSKEDRNNVKVGQHVRIGLEDPNFGGERFWVKVTERPSTGEFKYRGKIDNVLVVFNLALGSTIEFNPEHVLDVIQFNMDKVNAVQ